MQVKKPSALNFLERFTHALELKALKPADLFRQCGLAHSTMSRWKSGSLPRRSTIRDLAGILGVQPDWLEHGRGAMLAGIRYPDGKEPDPNARVMEISPLNSDGENIEAVLQLANEQTLSNLLANFLSRGDKNAMTMAKLVLSEINRRAKLAGQS